ncbi:MAG: hypothetical protein ABGX05_02600, partial [Pirellulaceae bacterium]
QVDLQAQSRERRVAARRRVRAKSSSPRPSSAIDVILLGLDTSLRRDVPVGPANQWAVPYS